MKNRLSVALTIFVVPVAAFLIGSCMTPLASKDFIRMDLAAKGARVEIEQTGTFLILSLFPWSETLDTKDVLLDLMQDEGCRDLKNVDIQYWNHTYYVISWDKVRIIADCVKSGPATLPPARPTVPPAAEPAKPAATDAPN